MLIIIDGPDGCGKTTISKKLAEDLDFAYIHYPFYENETGQKILNMLNHKLPWDPLTFQCLQICNKIQTIPTLKILEKQYGGVILDRYNPSTWVYGQLDGLSKDILNQLISVFPKINMEIIIVSDKPYRLNGDFYEKIDKWNKTKELYLKYAVKNHSGCTRMNFNNTTIEECIVECKAQIMESSLYRELNYCRTTEWS